jgi:septum formation protein
MKLILASQSPRRKLLLEQMGLVFDTVPSNFEEEFDQNKTSAEVAMELGMGKARAVAEKYPDAIVIGGDLVVDLDGVQLGKPESPEEAFEMLKDFSGRSHDILTSVAVVCKEKNYEKVAVEKSTITFGDMTDDQIWEFVNERKPYDLGGGYAIQHPLIKPHVKNIEGRIDTIIGMPTNLIVKFLKDFDYYLEPIEITGKEQII